ncbi:MAG: cupin domain-containing protein [Chloroflexota bacterium]
MNFDHVRAIGEKLRTIRQSRHMSLRELATSAEMSASMLSQIETGKAYPSVRSLYNIAEALEVPVDYFFPDEDNDDSLPVEAGLIAAAELTASEMREVQVGRAGGEMDMELMPNKHLPTLIVHTDARPKIELKGGVIWSRLTAFAEPDTEFLEITYVPGASSDAHMSHHEGREFGFILEGELVLELGFELYTLDCGDSIIFDSMTPHRLSNKSDKQMRALWVVLNRAS